MQLEISWLYIYKDETLYFLWINLNTTDPIGMKIPVEEQQLVYTKWLTLDVFFALELNIKSKSKSKSIILPNKKIKSFTTVL